MGHIPNSSINGAHAPHGAERTRLKMNMTELKQQIIELSNKLKMSDGELLDLILDEGTIKNAIEKIKQWTLIEKLKTYFNTDNVENTPDGYPDEFTINNDLNIEVVTKITATRNELDFIDNAQEKEKFLLEIIEKSEPEEIGAYKQIETNLYYREL